MNSNTRSDSDRFDVQCYEGPGVGWEEAGENLTREEAWAMITSTVGGRHLARTGYRVALVDGPKVYQTSSQESMDHASWVSRTPR